MTPEQIRELAEKSPEKIKLEILDSYDPNEEYPSYYHESHVLEAMETYAKYIAGASLNTSGGLRRVKASERLPQDGIKVFIITGLGEKNVAWYNVDNKNWYWSDPEGGIIDEWSINKMEWLDESGQSGEGDGWISVEDRLPEHGSSPKYSNDVLIYTGTGRMETAFYCFMDSTWNDSTENEIFHPTHWKPLPAPPIKSSGEQKGK